MKTNNQVTQIFLERYVEDIALIEEINKISIELNISGTREFVERYPTLVELLHQLKISQA